MSITWGSIWPRLLYVSIILLLIVGYLRFFEWRSLYYPARELKGDPSEMGLEFEDIRFVAEDDCKLHGWWIPHEEARGTVIVFHGNAGNIGDRTWMVGDLHKLGLNIFIFDYRGYGKSSGMTREKGLYRDARAAFEVVRAKYADSEEPPVILYGRSLGGSVAVQLALEKPVKGLILESTFTSTIAMAKKLYPVLPSRLLCSQRYDSLAKIDRVTVPLMIAHSLDDTLIPYEMGQALFEKATTPTKIFCQLRGDHNDSGWTLQSPYWLQIEAFLDSVLQ